MPQQVYSVRLWSLVSTEGATTFPGPAVPTGFVWVVRDVRMVNSASPAFALASPLILSAGGTLNIFSSPSYSSVPGILYEWHGRAVVVAGESLEAVTNSPNWSMTVDGYQLSTP